MIFSIDMLFAFVGGEKYGKHRRKNHAGTQDKSLVHNLLSLHGVRSLQPADAFLCFVLDKKQTDAYTKIATKGREKGGFFHVQ